MSSSAERAPEQNNRRRLTSMSLRRSISTAQTAQKPPLKQLSSPGRTIAKRPSSQALKIMTSSMSTSEKERPPSMSSALGKRRLEGMEVRKRDSIAEVSEFGAIKRAQNGSDPVSSIRSSVTMRNLPLRSSLNISNSPQSSSTLSSSTAAARKRVLKGETLPLKAASRSFTPTRASEQRIASQVQQPSFKSSQGNEKSEEQTTSIGNPILLPSQSLSSVKARAAAWASPKPGVRREVSTNNLRAKDSHSGAHLTNPKSEASLTRRTSLIQPTSRVTRSDSMKARRTSMLASQFETPVRPGQVKESSPLKRALPSWGQWREIGGSSAANAEKDLKTPEVTATTNVYPFDLVDDSSNGSLLMNEDILKEIDAEVGRLGLDKSVMGPPSSSTVIETGKGRALKGREEAQMWEEAIKEQARREFQQQQKALLSQVEQERDEAQSNWRQVKEELEALQRQAAIEAEKRTKRRVEVASQTNLSIQAKAGESYKQAQAMVKTLTLERLTDEWKGVGQLASNQIEQLDSQYDFCLYFLRQLDSLMTNGHNERND